MHLPIRIAASLPILLLLLDASSAMAQSAMTVEAPPTLVAPGNAAAPPQLDPPNAVNYAACLGDESFRFQISATPALAVGQTMQVWVGEGTTDCTYVSNRIGSTAQCWQVGTITPLAPTSLQVDVRIQDMLSQFGMPTKITSPRGDASSCGILNYGPHALTLYFFGAEGVQGEGSAASYAATAETVSAITAGDVAVTPDDGVAHVALLGAPDPSASFAVYCEPLAGNASTGDGGSDACTGGVLASSKHGPYGPTRIYQGPPPDSYVCGTIQKGSTHVDVTGLTNGKTYAVAVAAIDLYGNHGDLSSVTCVTPMVGTRTSTSDLEGCAIGPASPGAGLEAFVLGFAALAIARIRRKRITH